MGDIIRSDPNENTESTEKVAGTIPYVAALINKHFPELGGRAIAVSDAEITKDNVPTLPLCMVALDHEIGNHDAQQRAHATPVEEFIVEFWMPPVKYNDANDKETPFWSYYDYHTLRNKLLHIIFDMKPPLGGRVEYVRLDIEAVQFAVIITFRLKHKYEFCYQSEDTGQEFTIVSSITAAASEFCGTCTEPEEEDPCPT